MRHCMEKYRRHGQFESGESLRSVLFQSRYGILRPLSDSPALSIDVHSEDRIKEAQQLGPALFHILLILPVEQAPSEEECRSAGNLHTMHSLEPVGLAQNPEIKRQAFESVTLPHKLFAARIDNLHLCC